MLGRLFFGRKNRAIKTSEKIENILAFCSILSVFVLNYVSSTAATVTNMIILMFMVAEFFFMVGRNQLSLSYGIYGYALFTFLCFVSCIYSSSQDDSISKTQTLVLLLLYMVALYNYVQYHDRKYLLLKYIVISAFVASAYLLYHSSWQTGERATSIIGDANTMGAYITFGFVCVYYLLKSKEINLIFALVIFATLGLSTVISGSRSAILELFVGVILMQISFDIATRQQIIKRFLGAIAIVILILALYHLIMNYEAFYDILGERIESLFDIMSGNKSSINEQSTFRRIEVMNLALEQFKNSPFFGNGIATMQNYLQTTIHFNAYAHNNYVELLAGVGIFGTVAYYYFYAKTLSIYAKNRNQYTVLGFVIVVQMLIAHYAVVFYYQKLEVVFMVLIMAFNDDYVAKSKRR